MVLLVGDVAIGQKLLPALGSESVSTESMSALGVIKTKYYSAPVQRLGVIDWDDPPFIGKISSSVLFNVELLSIILFDNLLWWIKTQKC